VAAAAHTAEWVGGSLRSTRQAICIAHGVSPFGIFMPAYRSRAHHAAHLVVPPSPRARGFRHESPRMCARPNCRVR